MLEDLEDLPVRIRYRAADRGTIADLAPCACASRRCDTWMPANALGELTLQPELASITRRNGERVNEVLGFLRQGTLPIEVARAVQSTSWTPDAWTCRPATASRSPATAPNSNRRSVSCSTYVPVLATLMIATLVLSFRSFALAGLIGVVAVFSVGLGMLSLWARRLSAGLQSDHRQRGLIGVAINGSIVVLAAIRANPRRAPW